MIKKNQAAIIQYMAWDTGNNSPKTGDVANHTLKLIQDGTANTPTNSPTEVNSTSLPGIYQLSVTAAETNYNFVTLAGKSSTANIVIIPVPMGTIT